MKSIVLPAGTEHVQFGELAHLIADALWPDAGPDDDSMTNAFARINLDAELARAVDSGALPVKDPLTLGPHTYPVGYALKTALVTVDDLQRFVSDRGLSVIVETPEPQAADAPAAKGEAVPAPMQRQQFQELEILRVIRELKYGPTKLPKVKQGNPGVKAEVRAKLDLQVGIFDKAWERLRKQGEIKDAK